MPPDAPDSVHQRKKAKNAVTLALLLVWCVLIWAVTMVKAAHAQNNRYPPEKAFLDQRQTHLEDMVPNEERWHNEWVEDGKRWDEEQARKKAAAEKKKSGMGGAIKSFFGDLFGS